MYLLRHDAKKSVAEIQRLFGNRDHSTVIGAIDRIEKELPTRPETAEDLAAIRPRLSGDDIERRERREAEATSPKPVENAPLRVVQAV
jgi:hypothetical protein